jgi:hypothetical protein
MAGPSFDYIDGRLHRASPEPVQGFLEGLIGSPEYRTCDNPDIRALAHDRERQLVSARIQG